MSVDYKNICHALFEMLDDIDTADDIAKGNEKLYRNLVRTAHKRRFEYADTDGFNLAFKNGPDVEINDDGLMAFNATTKPENGETEEIKSPNLVRWEYIQSMFELYDRNVSETARRLNMHRHTLQRILSRGKPQ